MNELLGALITAGYFVSFACDSGGEQIARLESESMPAVESGCLELWHHAEGYLIGSEYIVGIDVKLNIKYNINIIQLYNSLFRPSHLIGQEAFHAC